MAITRTASQITWSAAAEITLTAGTPVDSDPVTLDPSCVGLSLTVWVDNLNATPQAGDVVKVRVKYSPGDVAGGAEDDYDTTEHALSLGQIDTVSGNTPGEDPAQRSWVIPHVPQKFRVSVEAPQAAARNIKIRARIEEQRAA